VGRCRIAIAGQVSANQLIDLPLRGFLFFFFFVYFLVLFFFVVYFWFVFCQRFVSAGNEATVGRHSVADTGLH